MQHVLRNTRLIVGLLLIAVGIGATLHAQDPMAAKLQEICAKHRIPAMTAAVVRSGGLVNAQCYGVRKRGTTDKVQLTDRFPIGSCTKSMTATLAGVLVDAGKIQWKTTIGEVWPKANDDHIHPKLRNVTLDELLSHQSGLPENISEISPQAWAGFFRQEQSPTLERRRMLKIVLPKPPMKPQDSLSYSNVGYAVAAAMLETRAQEAFESLMRKHVFAPLEMRSADFRTNQSAKQLRPPMLWGHQADGKPIDPRLENAENPTVYASAGTVHLTIEDYAKYARWHLAGKAKPVLQSQTTFDHLHAPLVDYPAPNAKYACGWICLDVGLGPALNHSGSNTNTFALIWILPESDFAAVACANTFEPQAFTACDEMISHLILKHATKKPEGMEKPGTAPGPGSVDPKRLEGRYQLTPNFVFDVRHKNGHMMVGITNQPTNEVFADSPTKWSYRGIDAQIEFHIRGKGPAYALTLHQNGLAQKAKRIGN